ncbi:MAG: hypothetical protein JRH01_18420 [Deltaproteobacteria bacterium]|nr:hypothetical protein [Deltaproteobacteria bacterium]
MPRMMWIVMCLCLLASPVGADSDKPSLRNAAGSDRAKEMKLPAKRIPAEESAAKKSGGTNPGKATAKEALTGLPQVPVIKGSPADPLKKGLPQWKSQFPCHGPGTSASASSSSTPQAQVGQLPGPANSPSAQLVASTEISMKNRAGLIGEIIELRASLRRKQGNAAVPYMPVTFTINGAFVATINTGKDGVARQAYHMPELFGARTIEASFGGTVVCAPSEGAANLATVQAPAQLSVLLPAVQKVVETKRVGSQTVEVQLSRTTDGQGLAGQTIEWVYVASFMKALQHAPYQAWSSSSPIPERDIFAKAEQVTDGDGRARRADRMADLFRDMGIRGDCVHVYAFFNGNAMYSHASAGVVPICEVE